MVAMRGRSRGRRTIICGSLVLLVVEVFVLGAGRLVALQSAASPRQALGRHSPSRAPPPPLPPRSDHCYSRPPRPWLQNEALVIVRIGEGGARALPTGGC